MYGSRAFKQFMVFIITFILLSITMITCFVPHLQSEGGLTSIIDQHDGFYYSDTFSELSSSNLNNTVISSGNIILDPQGTTDYIYNFSDWTNASSNRAYYYNTVYFLSFYPPSSHISRENEFGNADYDRIAIKDNNTYPSLTSGQATSRQQVQHYRFKITQDIDSLTKLGLYWHGKAENDLKITLYYWQPYNFGSFGLWQQADETTSNGSFVSLRQNFTGDLFVDNNGYIDICVVLTPTYSTKCTLYTDYVDVSCQGSGYASKGTIQSIPIQPNYISRWEKLYWKDFEESQTSIHYHLLYENETGILHYIENNYVPGNLDGLSQSPIDLSSIPTSYNLTIQANLSTNDLSHSPILYQWAVNWQTTEDRWQDSFNSTLRIDNEQRENIEITAGNADLIPVLNHWPMFAGPTATNNRASEGIGPDNDHTDLAWYSEVNTGGENKNPVIKNAKLYASSQDGEKIYCFEAQATTGSITFNPVEAQTEIPNHLIKNTPLVTDDYVVVSTGSSSKGGGIGNKIYGFDHDLGDSPAWIFDYATVHSNNPSICYHSSPVYSNGDIYITSWNGDDSILSSIWNYINFSKGNNVLMKLDEDGNYEWEYALPTGSFCSPAANDDTVVACCDRINGNSVFAVNHNGVEQWNQKIGPIGYASPVIYEDKVIIVTKKPTMLPVTAHTAVYALDLNDGTILWNQTIGDNTVEPYQYAGYNTPTVAEDAVFVSSPDGFLYAFNIENGSQLWKKNVYNKGLFSMDYLLSSPAYANGIIYLGTPDGALLAIDAETNETLWTENTIDGTGIISSPIVVDGLVYYIEKSGSIQCRGELQLPTGEEVEGVLLTNPISLPEDHTYIWNRFYADYSTTNGDITFDLMDEDGDTTLLSDIEDGQSISTETVNAHTTIRLKAEMNADADGEVSLHEWAVTYEREGEEENETIFFETSFTSNDIPPNCSIEVRNENIGLWNTSAAYELEYSNASGDQSTGWIPTNCTGVNGSTARETITANLSMLNFTENISQYDQIRFKIKDTQGDETFSEWHQFSDIIYPDEAKPSFDETGFEPATGWVSSPTPTCQISVIDEGTGENISGLNVSSATFTLNYTDNTGDQTDTFEASCSGSEGTESTQTITATVVDVDESENITDVSAIRFTIEDMAGNSNTSSWFTLTLDDAQPTSQISNTGSIPAVTNESPVVVEATAEDDLSGIEKVTLYYRLTSSVQWNSFSSDTSEPYEWDFTIGTNDAGEYDLCTIATDNAGNEESFPSTPAVTFLFDPNPPNAPTFDDEYRFTEAQIPAFDDVTFTDDYQLKQVSYRLNFEGLNEWTIINEEDLSVKTYTPAWNLTETQWNQMQEDTTYYLYFKVIDLLGNTFTTSSQSSALQIIKDLDNATPYDPDLSDFDNWRWNNEYTIKVDVNESNLTYIQLWYQYSSDNESWSNWTQYGDNLTVAPFEWIFTLPDGSGYYNFKTKIFVSEETSFYSEEKMVEVSIFPLVELMMVLILAVILFIVSALLFSKRKKMKA